jgi:hypothetical protein
MGRGTTTRLCSRADDRPAIRHYEEETLDADADGSPDIYQRTPAPAPND